MAENVAMPVNFSLRELAEVLVRHQNFHSGNYEVSVNFEIAVGAVGPSANALLPGAMIGISGVGLVPALAIGPHTVDAAEVNPAPKKPRTKAKGVVSA